MVDSSTNNKALGEGSIGKQLLRYALPSIASLILASLYTIVDQIFVGNSRLGPEIGNGAIGIVFPLLVITQAFSYLLGDGCAAYLSICQGREDKHSAGKTISGCLSLTLIISVILMAIYFIFPEPLLRLFGATDMTIKPAKDYLFILTFFIPAYMLQNMSNPIVRSDGHPNYSLLTTAVGAILNIILDLVFVRLLHWGIEGAAAATGISMFASYILLSLYFFKPKTFVVKWKDLLLKWSMIKPAINLGLSSFVTQMSIVVINLVTNIVIVKYGALSIYGTVIPISALAIESKWFSIIANIVVGISVGAQPILGYNIGAGKIDRVKKTYRLMLIWSMLVGIVATLFFELFPRETMLVFGNSDDPLYWEYGIVLIRVFLGTIALSMFMKVTTIFFQACGYFKPAAIISLSRDILFFVPWVFLIPFIAENIEAGTGIYAMLYSIFIADGASAILSLIFTFFVFKKMNQINAEPKGQLTEEL